jgi:gliding motility-associated protein GldM
MASTNDTPRQKMIGMMYLVLTALLALNVSKDILDAFIVVNKGLENTSTNFTDHNDNLYSEFDLAKSIDPVLVTPNWKLAQQVKKHSEALTDYIDRLQKKLVAQTEGVSQSVADTLQMAEMQSKDNYDTPSNILIGNSEDGSAGASRELKNKLNEYKAQLLKCVLPADQKKIKLDIDTENPKHTENNENWELYNFYHRPLVACVTILSKFKNDVKNAEAVIVDYLLKQNDSEIMKFDTIAAKVIPLSNYVMLGENYSADVFIAAFSKTKKPEVTIGNYDDQLKTFNGATENIPVQNGLGKYIVKADKEGIVSYSGTIKIKSAKGKDALFPFKSEYIVARPSLTVSADKMNVVYVGLENPISVSVPGVPNERLTITASNAQLKSNGNGKYILKVTNGPKVDVAVSAMMENGEKRNMGMMTFRVMRVPKPLAKIGDITGGGVMSKGELLAQKELIAYYDNFQFEATTKVISFDVAYKYQGIWQPASIVGNQLSSLANVFKKVSKGDIILFENIKAIGPDGAVVKLNPLSIKVF